MLLRHCGDKLFFFNNKKPAYVLAGAAAKAYITPHLLHQNPIETLLNCPRKTCPTIGGPVIESYSKENPSRISPSQLAILHFCPVFTMLGSPIFISPPK